MRDCSGLGVVKGRGDTGRFPPSVSGDVPERREIVLLLDSRCDRDPLVITLGMVVVVSVYNGFDGKGDLYDVVVFERVILLLAGSEDRTELFLNNRESGSGLKMFVVLGRGTRFGYFDSTAQLGDSDKSTTSS